jgi:hypothetical protein
MCPQYVKHASVCVFALEPFPHQHKLISKHVCLCHLHCSCQSWVSVRSWASGQQCYPDNVENAPPINWWVDMYTPNSDLSSGPQIWIQSPTSNPSLTLNSWILYPDIILLSLPVAKGRNLGTHSLEMYAALPLMYVWNSTSSLPLYPSASPSHSFFAWTLPPGSPLLAFTTL